MPDCPTKHWWATLYLPRYGYIVECTDCGAMESAEHTQQCFDVEIYEGKPCICGAEKEFQEFVAGRAGNGREVLNE